MEVLEVTCNLSALSKVRCIFPGTERSSLCHWEICPCRQDFFNSSDAEACSFLQFTSAGQTGHRATLIVIIWLRHLLWITTVAIRRIFISWSNLLSLMIVFFCLCYHFIMKRAEFFWEQTSIVWFDIEMYTVCFKVLMQLYHDSFFVHIPHDFSHVLTRIAFAAASTCRGLQMLRRWRCQLVVVSVSVALRLAITCSLERCHSTAGKRSFLYCGRSRWNGKGLMLKWEMWLWLT